MINTVRIMNEAEKQVKSKRRLVNTASTMTLVGGHTIHTQRQDGRGFYLNISDAHVTVGEVIVTFEANDVINARFAPTKYLSNLYMDGDRYQEKLLLPDLVDLVRYYLQTYYGYGVTYSGSFQETPESTKATSSIIVWNIVTNNHASDRVGYLPVF